jgi:hypothetical protein
MRIFKRLAVSAALAAAVVGTVAGTALASPASAQQRAGGSGAAALAGGATSVTTAPGIAAALLGHGIVPLATLPGTEGAAAGASGVAVTFTFPVTGGSVSLKHLTGTVSHGGGIVFIAPATGKQIAVSDFVINLRQRVLTAVVNGNAKAPVPLFSLSLASAQVAAGRHAVRISGLVVRLTHTAAAALDATFGTSLFTTGLELGTAATQLRF